MTRDLFVSLVSCCCVAVCALVANADKYSSRVGVQHPTRLDWSFVVAEQSLEETPPEWVNHVYDSTKQSYEWFGPDHQRRPGVVAATGKPLLIHVSPKGRASGWKHWEPVCRRLGMMYAGPRGTVKGTRDSLRIRIVLDVLDDVRRRHHVDPDRTYIAGFYGGARIANQIAFRLPEYFGGVVAIAEGVPPPAQPFHQARLVERLSVMQVVGRQDRPGAGNQRVGMMRMLNAEMQETDIRTQLTFYQGSVTEMAPSGVLLQAVRWLERDLERRRDVAKVYPSTSLSNAPSRQEHARLVLTDAITDLSVPKTTYRGLLRLEHVRQRWPNLDAALEADALLEEYAQREGPWQQQRDEDRKRALATKIRKLRPIHEADPPRQSTQLPAAWDAPERWIKTNTTVHRDSNTDHLEYDERTQFVLRRLGRRVQRDVNGRVAVIDLSSTRVTSTQLRHFKDQLHGMSELRALNLSAAVMRESTLRHLAGLASLQALKLSHVDLTNQGLVHLEALPNLRYLSVADTRVTTTGIQRLKSLRHLACLNLGGTKVGNDVLPYLAEARDLRVLSLASTNITSAIDLRAFRALHYLDLTNTSANDDVVATLEGLPNLRTLVLNYTRVTDACVLSLAKLAGLQELSLLGTKFGDAGLAKLASLSSLSRVNVRSTRVSQGGLDAFAATRPAVRLISEANRIHSVESQRLQLESADNQ